MSIKTAKSVSTSESVATVNPVASVSVAPAVVSSTVATVSDSNKPLSATERMNAILAARAARDAQAAKEAEELKALETAIAEERKAEIAKRDALLLTLPGIMGLKDIPPTAPDGKPTTALYQLNLLINRMILRGTSEEITSVNVTTMGGRGKYTPEQQSKAIALFREGKPASFVSQETGVPLPTLNQWKAKAGLTRSHAG